MVHLGKGEIEDFLAGRLEASNRRRVILHLLGGCSRCQSRWKSLAEPLLGEEPWVAAEPVAEESYDEALSRVGAAAKSFLPRWRKESAKLQRALSLLEQFPKGFEDASFPARQAQALHGWPLCEALLRKSHEVRFSDPKRMLELAEDAAGVAKHARAEKYPWPGLLADLRARAFAEMGNAYRINDRLSEADAAFERARDYLDEGTGDLFLRAHVLDLEASFRRAQRRLEDAIALLDQVHGLYLEAEDLHLAGRALISKGVNTHYRGYPREAVGLCEEGLRLLDPDRDSHLLKISQQVLLLALADCAEYRKASRLLLQSGLREAFEGEPLNLLKLRWVEGKVHAGLGRLAQAERAFCEARREFVRHGQVYDAAMVGLELAALWLRQGRAAEVQELAEEMYETFEDLGIQMEAARALQFVHEACRLQAVTVSMIERVRTFLERLPWHPGLRFEPELFAP
jgi:tetratricopeptide (TPR) repeat protein